NRNRGTQVARQHAAARGGQVGHLDLGDGTGVAQQRGERVVEGKQVGTHRLEGCSRMNCAIAAASSSGSTGCGQSMASGVATATMLGFSGQIGLLPAAARNTSILGTGAALKPSISTTSLGASSRSCSSRPGSGA